MKPVINVYDQLGVEDPQLMLEKATIVAEIITLITTSDLSILEASERTTVGPEYLMEIIRGQFHNTSLEELKAILTRLLET